MTSGRETFFRPQFHFFHRPFRLSKIKGSSTLVDANFQIWGNQPQLDFIIETRVIPIDLGKWGCRSIHGIHNHCVTVATELLLSGYWWLTQSWLRKGNTVGGMVILPKLCWSFKVGYRLN